MMPLMHEHDHLTDMDMDLRQQSRHPMASQAIPGTKLDRMTWTKEFGQRKYSEGDVNECYDEPPQDEVLNCMKPVEDEKSNYMYINFY